MKKKNLALSLVFLILISLPFIWMFSREYILTNPDNRYRAPRVSPDAHEIRIDDYYSVNSISVSFSILQYDDGENHVEFSDTIDKLNWNNEYIIAASKTDKLAVYSNDYYLIINKDTRESKEYDSVKQFENALKEKNIDLKLKRKVEFDWY